MNRHLLHAIALLWAARAPACLPTCAQIPVYKDPAAPVSQRVADLLGRMTLEEKIAQVGGDVVS